MHILNERGRLCLLARKRTRELDKKQMSSKRLVFQMRLLRKKKASPVKQNMEAIKAYAYEAFDKLDRNHNGFIETDELYAAMDDAENANARQVLHFVPTDEPSGNRIVSARRRIRAKRGNLAN